MKAVDEEIERLGKKVTELRKAITEKENKNMVLLSKQDVLSISINKYPMLVLSDNLRSFFAWGIKAHQHGNYNHFMWLLGKNNVVTQDLTFRTSKLDDYFSKCRMKFWYNPDWTEDERMKMLSSLYEGLKQPWYSKMYDPLQIFGKLFHIKEMQIKGIDICSDWGRILKNVDYHYDLEHPSPTQINVWLSEHPQYKVYGRYVPD